MMRVAFITGASAGFGASCARRFAGQDWRLILTARRLDRLQELRKELGGTEHIHIANMDVRERDAIQSVLDNLPGVFQNIDLLINNAGLALGLDPSDRAKFEDWETMVDTNIKGLLYCTRLILPGMVKRNQGHIINIGSVAGSWPYPGGNVYGATKAFVQQFSRNLRADLLGKQIRVTNIEPGMAETEFSLVRFKGNEARAAKVYQNIQPLTAEDIAEIAWWVTSLPQHVNINAVEVMPTLQAWGPLKAEQNKS